jgi:hypothetical protein
MVKVTNAVLSNTHQCPSNGDKWALNSKISHILKMNTIDIFHLILTCFVNFFSLNPLLRMCTVTHFFNILNVCICITRGEWY